MTHELPESRIPLDLAGRIVVVVDDVLYTGRTVRSPRWMRLPISGDRLPSASAFSSIEACANFHSAGLRRALYAHHTARARQSCARTHDPAGTKRSWRIVESQVP